MHFIPTTDSRVVSTHVSVILQELDLGEKKMIDEL
jgi:hypothetical protein